MRISELSRRSGVSIPTIKFYIREKLLPAGRHTAPNQAVYDREHLERLRLIRALREQGGLSLAVIGDALEAARLGQEDYLTRGIDASRQKSRPSQEAETSDAAFAEAEEKVAALSEELGWSVDLEDPAMRQVVEAYAALKRVWPTQLKMPPLVEYAKISEQLALLEMPESWNPFNQPEERLTEAVLGTYLIEPVILALRRAAHRQRGRRLIDRMQEKQAEGRE